tara:strand:+ start:317 stop:445 length:129 start_codon:yes stop_codon:yes gene_type:complete
MKISWFLIYVIAILITIYGVITKKFLFIFLALPLIYFNKNKN